VGVNPRVIQTSQVQKTEQVHRKGGKILEVPKLNLSLRSEDARELSRPSDLGGK
jgi:hypothetical protein